ncbi:DinB family protein [Candidatus Laterigemmans baculatus]|uniref:DinB family protein n=1 Tax=Candidatus Laterigemmans baculatus TaxID=2770505 RepID=UPI0013DA6EBE|nr:DinB family protein [Candidatus Laterigemmans baculatus]
MNAVALIRRLHEHRSWVNQKLLSASGSLSDDQLRQPFPIGQGSIWKSLLHMYAAEYVWLEALRGNAHPLVPGDQPDKLPGNQQAEGGMASLAELAANWGDLNRRWEDYLDALAPESLGQRVVKKSTSSGRGKTHSTSRADVLLHVCTHAQYTTAQVVNMLRQVAADSLPDVMLITLAREESISGADLGNNHE